MPRYLYYDENGKCEPVDDWKTFTVLILANAALIGGIWWFCHYKGWF